MLCNTTGAGVGYVADQCYESKRSNVIYKRYGGCFKFPEKIHYITHEWRQ